MRYFTTYTGMNKVCLKSRKIPRIILNFPTYFFVYKEKALGKYRRDRNDVEM